MRLISKLSRQAVRTMSRPVAGMPQIRWLSTTTPFLGRIIPYKLADIGEGITEVQVLSVKVKVGDAINEFDPICEVQSDKATVDITSRYTGVVRSVHVTAGQTAKVGEAIIEMEMAEGDEQGAAAAAPPPNVEVPPPKPAAAATGGPKLIPYKLADIGEGITEVQVLNVKVKVGDTIEEFDPICEVQSDKATVDITSRYSGVIKAVHVVTGTTAKVGSTLIDIEVAGEGGTAPSAAGVPPPASAPASPQVPLAAAPAGGKVLATPATRYLARQHSLDLSLVPPTGKGGRVTKEDVLRYMETGGASAAKPAASAATPAAPKVVGAVAGVPVEAGDEVIPITGVRRGMVKSMTQAAGIPVFGFSEEYELSRLMAVRGSMKEAVARRTDGKVKLSFMPFFLKCASMALHAHPDVNAYCPPDCSVLVRKASHNIGFAMDTPNGLIVPVIRDVEKKSILEIAMDMQSLIDRGRKNKLTTADMTGGTFTLSNIGTIGATNTSPVILPPQVAIGAIGRLQKLPRFDAKGNVYPANICVISFTADHRVIDGATMVRFACDYKALLENPDRMLVDLR